MNRDSAIATTLAATVGFGLLVLLDVVVAASLYLVWLVSWALVAVLVSWTATDRREMRLRVVLVLLAVGTGMRWVDLNSLKPFMRDLNSIQPGMSVAEVETLMSRWLGGTGFPANPYSREPAGEFEIAGARVYRHTNEGWGNADWGIVSFENGHVTQVSFSPD